MGQRRPTAEVAATSDRVTTRRALIASASGAFLEWYDFFLFGTAAGLIFPALFFPGGSQASGLIGSFGAFAAGFIMRPVGAVLFGHWGDRIGRRRMLLVTVVLMGGGTLLIGLLPTYQSIGVAAPALLVAVRLVQGLGIGGEFGGGALVALENAPPGRRGLMSSVHQLGTPVGLLVSTGIFACVQLLPPAALTGWGWRVPFLASALFLALVVYIRKNLPETATFQADRARANRFPIVALLREHPRNILLATGARMADAVTFNVINVFGIAYATRVLGVDKQVMLTGFVIASAVEIAVIPIIGHISDRIGRRPVYLFGIAVCVVTAFAYFPLLATANTLVVWAAIVVALAIGTGCMFAIQGALFSELFATRTRYTGLGVAYQGSALIGGAPTPAIAAALAAAFTQSFWPVAIYMASLCLLSFACVWFTTETYRSDLTTSGKEDITS
jgi:MFS family permease